MKQSLPVLLEHVAEPTPLAPKPPIRGTVIYIAVVLLLTFGGFFTWAFAARLDAAAIAPGQIVVESQRKTVQHLEGGIIAEILVREGDIVQRGQPLIRLDEVQAQAQLDALRGERLLLIARRARLLSELEDRENLIFPAELMERLDEPRVEEIVIGQTDLFAARQQEFDNQLAIRQRQIAQLNQQISAFRAQGQAASEQLDLIGEEIDAVQELLDKGLERRPRLLALQRAASALRGTRGELDGRIAQARQSIAETELQIINLRNARRTDIADNLEATQSQIAQLNERIVAATDIFDRLIVPAPQSGKIIDMQVSTVGGVITASEPLMDIVPLEDTLVVEARVNPTDVEAVRPGLMTKVTLNAYSARLVPPVAGRVERVSADQLVDEAGMPYFAVKVHFDEEAVNNLPESVELFPGMPTTVMIATGERQAIDYFLAPVIQHARFAMREQ